MPAANRPDRRCRHGRHDSRRRARAAPASHCEIAELRPDLTEPGTGISLQGPALRALRAVGVVDPCIVLGFGYSHFKTCDAAGNVTGTVELPRLLGPDYPATVGILRQAVHEVLADELMRLACRSGSAPRLRR